MSFRKKYSADNPANCVRPGWVFTMQHPAHLIALFFGAGCLRPAPGTWGTLAGVVVWAALVQFLPLSALLALIVAFFFVGVWASQKTGEDLGVEDAGCIVIDEVVAVWLVCVFFPQNLVTWTAAFLAFRLFDIVKLPPASVIDARMKNGWGVMLDDILAALWALALLFALDWLAGAAGVRFLGVFS